MCGKKANADLLFSAGANSTTLLLYKKLFSRRKICVSDKKVSPTPAPADKRVLQTPKKPK